MTTELIHIGFGNVLAVNRVIAMVSPNSAPTKR
ncbi:MAG: extracellular matrix/biofilm biosynthesis regulator RemA family protein, partial [Dehalococcoidia bacterium]